MLVENCDLQWPWTGLESRSFRVLSRNWILGVLENVGGVYLSGRRTSAEGASASAKGAKPPTIRGSGGAS